MQKEQDEKAAKKAKESERYHALRGKVMFAKLVWRHFQMGTDVFN